MALTGLALLDGFVVVGIGIGRVGVVTGVDVPIVDEKELLLIVVVVVEVILLIIPIISISRPITIAAIIVATLAILRCNRFSLCIVMDNALVFDWGEWPWPFVPKS